MVNEAKQIIKQIDYETENKKIKEKIAEKRGHKQPPINPAALQLQDLLYNKIIPEHLMTTGRFLDAALTALGWELSGDAVMAEKEAFKKLGVKPD